MAYGVDFSRYREPKRAAIDLDLGPLVATCMTRCISCTRCVRFITEVAGVPEMGQTGRGEDSEITSYLGRMLTSEMQGNVIDLCPVGALTSKPYAFTARPWELTKTESIDVMDALGLEHPRRRQGARGDADPAAQPRRGERGVAGRPVALHLGRAAAAAAGPALRARGRAARGRRPGREAFAAIAAAAKGKKVAGLVGDLVSTEAAFALKALVEGLGGTVECRTDGAALPAGNRSGYAGTATIADIDAARRILLVGTNPRVEAPVLNARIRKAWLHGARGRADRRGGRPHLSATSISAPAARRSRRSSGASGDDEVKAAPTLVIVGQGALTGADGAGGARRRRWRFCEATARSSWCCTPRRSRVGAMDLGCVTEGGVAAALGRGGGLQPRGGRDRHARRAVRGLPGQPWRPRGAPGRRDPAGGGLGGGAGRSSSTPRGGRRWRTAPASRRARRGRTGRSCGRCRRQLGTALPFDSLAALRAAMVAAVPHLGAIDRVPENAWTPARAGGYVRGRFRLGRCGEHYPREPGPAGERGDGGSGAARAASAPTRWRRSRGWTSASSPTASGSSC